MGIFSIEFSPSQMTLARVKLKTTNQDTIYPSSTRSPIQPPITCLSHLFTHEPIHSFSISSFLYSTAVLNSILCVCNYVCGCVCACVHMCLCVYVSMSEDNESQFSSFRTWVPGMALWCSVLAEAPLSAEPSGWFPLVH